ncbi:helix-turn-helix transcriptional regulator [Pararhizobium haloflavum]|uniref:helix-turn-helix transcriptional regulator n=1 Tax=Pararhizobium haloflavum TaxID=2037914 RepID=UPI000C187D7D|nr:helix-turn-helix transcriptional regulator [Pararhizobium haloflavum]
MHEFLTVREVADLLRIKERKLYDLTSEGALPVTKVTGKLIFPRDALMAWLRHNTDYGSALPALMAHPAVVAGSHDPLLDWALRASGSELATYYDGSADGLKRLKAGQAVAAGVHFHSAQEGTATVDRVSAEMVHEPVVLVEWARRVQGLIIKPELADGIRSIEDVAGRRVVCRQAGAGSEALFSLLLGQGGVDESDFTRLPEVARSQSDLAEAVAHGSADLGFGIEAVARQHKLAFVPLETERYDLLAWRRDFCEPPMQRLMDFTRTAAFAEHARQMGGYDVEATGRIIYNGA